jgi:hypothetical protein
LNNFAASDFQPFLLTGERVLWTGEPQQGIRFGAYDVFLIPFSLMWGGFAIFWNAAVWLSDGPIFFRLWGLPFLIVGLYLIFGRFFHDAAIRRRLQYAVTDRRVLTLRHARTLSLRSLDIARLPALELEQAGDDRGTIRFSSAEMGWGRNRGFQTWNPALGTAIQFAGIEHARSVYELIERQQKCVGQA